MSVTADVSLVFECDNDGPAARLRVQEDGDAVRLEVVDDDGVIKGMIWIAAEDRPLLARLIAAQGDAWELGVVECMAAMRKPSTGDQEES